MKVAAYLRVATRKQLPDGQQLAMQMSSIKAWADRGSHEIVRIYEDLVASGTDPSRPGLTLMLAEAESPERPFDAVVVATLSRPFRDQFILWPMRGGLARSASS
jgi:DNA invertase Pin-like site-specific DNA recombinase